MKILSLFNQALWASIRYSPQNFLIAGRKSYQGKNQELVGNHTRVRGDFHPWKDFLPGKSAWYDPGCFSYRLGGFPSRHLSFPWCSGAWSSVWKTFAIKFAQEEFRDGGSRNAFPKRPGCLCLAFRGSGRPPRPIFPPALLCNSKWRPSSSPDTAVEFSRHDKQAMWGSFLWRYKATLGPGPCRLIFLFFKNSTELSGWRMT